MTTEERDLWELETADLVDECKIARALARRYHAELWELAMGLRCVGDIAERREEEAKHPWLKVRK